MCELNDDELTHVVVANGVDTTNIPISLPSRTHIVKQQVTFDIYCIHTIHIVVLGKHTD